MSNDIEQILRRIRPQDAERAGEIFPDQQRAALLEGILATERPVRASQQRKASRRHRSALARPRVVLSSIGALAVAAIAATLFTGSAVSPAPARAAVLFRSPPGEDIIATVVNPFAAEKQLNAAFLAHGLHITVNLIAASPSVVGTAVYIGTPAGANNTIEPLQTGNCTKPDGKCPVGVRVSKTFTGQGAITLGRPAKPGERYETSGLVTSPGEAMHGMHFIGKTVATVLAQLRARHVTVPQYRYLTHHFGKSLRPIQVPGNWIVKNADAWAAGQVLLFVTPGSG